MSTLTTGWRKSQVVFPAIPEVTAMQTTPNAFPFHPGEQAAQAHAGVGAPGAAIRNFMLDQHRAFFALLPYLFAATRDDDGWPVATVLTGEPGFIQSPDANTLRIAAAPADEDPVARLFTEGRPIGLLGLDLATRRRNRANGTIAGVGNGGLVVTVGQSFGNCPQYIQTRMVAPAEPAAGAVERFDGLDAGAVRMIGNADTFFVASAASPRAGDGGVDISHRGGRPGFVKVDGGTLTIPDFRGNRYFNTLGNLLLEPRAALLFVDFTRGDLLHLQGITAIDWHPYAADAPEGAERIWRLAVTRGWRMRAALPLRWTFGDYAPTTARTGAWPGTANAV